MKWMEHIVFFTVINNRKYKFIGQMSVYDWHYEAYLNDRFVNGIIGRNEESVILDLVKLLENDK